MNAAFAIPGPMRCLSASGNRCATTLGLYSILQRFAARPAKHRMEECLHASAVPKMCAEAALQKPRAHSVDFKQLSLESVKWFMLLSAAWAILTFALAKTTWFAENPAGTAHQFVVLIPFLYFALRGSKMWFFDQRFVGVSKHDKLWGNYPAVASLLIAMFAFQVWDFSISLVIPEYCKPEFLIHHVCTALVAIISLTNGPHGFCMYYAPFYMGVSEVSSLPLALTEVFRMNADLALKFSGINTLCQTAFAVLFFSFRLLYWPYVAFDQWRSICSNNSRRALSICVLVGSIGFTTLQFYWGMLIVREAAKMLR